MLTPCFQEGRFDQALALYEPLARKATPFLDLLLSYRVALCLEGLGLLDQALQTCRNIVSRTTDQRLLAAAETSQARLWIRSSRPAEAEKILCRLLLRSHQSEWRDTPAAAEVRYLLALAVSMRLLPAEGANPLRDTLATPAESNCLLPSIAAGGALALTDPAKFEKTSLSAPAGPKKFIESLEVKSAEDNPAQKWVRASMPQTEVVRLLEVTAWPSGFRLDWSTAARERLTGRTALLELDQLPPLDVVRALLHPLGVVGMLEGDTLRLLTEDELPKTERALYWSQAARQTLENALRAHPDPPFLAGIYLTAGNLEAAAENLSGSVAWYQRLLRECPRSPAAVAASYNLGLIQRRLGQPLPARAALYRVVDGAPGNRLAPLAYLWIGRLALDQGDFRGALSALRRGLESASGSPGRPALAVTLAAVHLLLRDPQAANTVLCTHRTCLDKEPYAATATFLNALACYLSLEPRERAGRKAGDLLAAVEALPPTEVLGLLKKFLAGWAYGELGFQEQVAQVYEKALPALKGPLADEMAFTLAEIWKGSARKAEARRLLRDLAGSQDSRWAGPSRLALARWAVEDNLPKESLEWCRLLLARGGCG